MSYKTEFKFKAKPEEIFYAIHRYKVEQNPNKYFLGRIMRLLVNMEYKVLTTNSLGLGATYDWNIKVLGVPILKFKEKIVEWQEAKTVVYEAISGWRMYFRIDLEPVGKDTLVKVQINYSTGIRFIDNLPRIFVEKGLKRAARRLIKRSLSK